MALLERKHFDTSQGRGIVYGDAVPTAAPGMAAPQGTLYNINGTGTYYVKSGPAATDWSQVALTSGFLPLTGGTLSGALTVQGAFAAQAAAAFSQRPTVVGTGVALVGESYTTAQADGRYYPLSTAGQLSSVGWGRQLDLPQSALSFNRGGTGPTHMIGQSGTTQYFGVNSTNDAAGALTYWLTVNSSGVPSFGVRPLFGSTNLALVTSGDTITAAAFQLNGTTKRLAPNGAYLMLSDNGAALGLELGSLLVSNSYADVTNVPTNGIWSKGRVQSATDVVAPSFLLNGGRLHVNRSSSVNNALSWYSTTYNSWLSYMAPPTAGQTPWGTTPPVGSFVTSWALRSVIEPAAGFGWTWEYADNAGNSHTLVAELSYTGTLNVGASYAIAGATVLDTYNTGAYVRINGGGGGGASFSASSVENYHFATTHYFYNKAQSVQYGYWNTTALYSAYRIQSADNVRAGTYFYADQQYGSGLVGLYDPTRYRLIYAMGDSYKPALDGTTLGTMYGLFFGFDSTDTASGYHNITGYSFGHGFGLAAAGAVRGYWGENGLWISNKVSIGGSPGSSYALNVSGDIIARAGWLRTLGGFGLYNEQYGTYWMAESANYWTSRSGAGILIEDLAGVLKGRVYFDTSGIGFLNDQGGWSVQCRYGTQFGGTLYGSWGVSGSLSAASLTVSGAGSFSGSVTASDFLDGFNNPVAKVVISSSAPSGTASHGTIWAKVI